MLTIRTCLALLTSVALTCARAERWIDTCPGEEIELPCPAHTEAIKNNEYESHFVYVTDPNYSGMKPQKIAYCEQTRCTTYPPTKRFAQRIKVRNTVPGNISVTQWKSEELTYICKVELKGNRKADEDEINVSSFVKCLTVPAHQDINLSQELGENAISPQAVQGIWWSIILPDGKELEIVYCNSTFCLDLPRPNKSYPAYLQRLKIDGMSLILKDVGKDDQELQFKCRTEPNMRGKSASPGPRVYKLKIKNVTESAPELNNAVPNSTIPTPKERPTPSTGSASTIDVTQTSAAGRVTITFFVIVNLVIVLVFIM